MSRVLVAGAGAHYEVLKHVAYTVAYRLYVCREVTSQQYYLLQIATDRTSNGGLERSAFILGHLADASHRYDEAYAQDHDGHTLHYDRLFPQLIETFVSPEQDGRRVNILAFVDVPDIERLIPMSNLRSKDRLRVDPKTNAWIMGRLLKLLTLVHTEGISISLNSRNVLLERDKHFAIVPDWTSSWMHQSNVPAVDAARNIAHAAQAAYDALGDIDTAHYAFDDIDLQYIDLLRRLRDSTAGELTANQAHTMFYDLVRDIWPREFHPFTTLPL